MWVSRDLIKPHRESEVYMHALKNIKINVSKGGANNYNISVGLRGSEIRGKIIWNRKEFGLSLYATSSYTPVSLT